MEQSERAKQQGMNAELVKLADVDLANRFSFFLSQIVTFHESGAIGAIRFSVLRVPVDFVHELLQLVEAHFYVSSL